MRWNLCAGPQGHIDQANSKPINLSALVYSRPVIPCRVSAVNFFVDPNSDEVFLKILLHPVTDGTAKDFLPPAGADNGDDERVVSYAKILTQTDANNGGGFTVRKSCADLIFPELNFEGEWAAKMVSLTDFHGTVWKIRLIYRGKPRQHLFTTGWGKIVNSKRLVSGDTVIFMKDSDGKTFVGFRRREVLGAFVGMDEQEMENEEEEEDEEVMTKRFVRDGKGRVSSELVAEAMELAAQNKPFEVVYYPSVGWGEFVVKAEDVDVKMDGIHWSVGMRVKIAWFQGTVSAVSVPGADQPWTGSPWRMLQITWDDPQILEIANPVSPWQVEILPSAP